KTRVLHQLVQKLIVHAVDFLRIGAGHRKRILALILTGDAGADFQDRKRAQESEDSGNRVQISHHLRGDLSDWRALSWWFNESESYSLIRSQKSRRAGQRKVGDHIRVFVQLFIDPGLKLVHLFGRGAFACDEGAKDHAAVARWQESL